MIFPSFVAVFAAVKGEPFDPSVDLLQIQVRSVFNKTGCNCVWTELQANKYSAGRPGGYWNGELASAARFTNVDDAKAACETVSDCNAVTQNSGSWELRSGEYFAASPSGETTAICVPPNDPPPVHIVNPHTGYCLALDEETTEFEGSNVGLYPCSDSSCQKWKFYQKNGGGSIIINQRCGLCMRAVPNGNVIASPCMHGPNYEWDWQCDSLDGKMMMGNKCLDIWNGWGNQAITEYIGRNVQGFGNCHGNWNQIWQRDPTEPHPFNDVGGMDEFMR